MHMPGALQKIIFFMKYSRGNTFLENAVCKIWEKYTFGKYTLGRYTVENILWEKYTLRKKPGKYTLENILWEIESCWSYLSENI